MPSVAVIIIGNEILSGKFAEENGAYLIGRLRALGADLRRMVFVLDEHAAIAEEVLRCSQTHDWVITTGGVGPTHDDITYEAVAQAFDAPLEVREELVRVLRRYEKEPNAAALRMATVPRGTVLHQEEGLVYPVVQVRNVLVFPGVPWIFKIKFEAFAEHLRGTEVLVDRIFTDEAETAIADRLTAVAVKYATVAIGSYPRFGEDGTHHVIVTVESRDRPAFYAAAAALRASLRTFLPSA